MRRIKELWGKVTRKFRNLHILLIHSWWYFIYSHVKLDENLVYVESRDAMDLGGNTFRIVEELSKGEYGKMKVVIWVKKEALPKVREFQKKYHLNIHRLITNESRAVAAMERAKYLVSDSGVPWGYVKREGQVFLNTWHGTPLKIMGRHVEGEKHIIGSTQHFFFSSDYLLYPSDYMKTVMLQNYMVEDVISGKALMSGYPRNSVFLDEERAQSFRQLLGLADKRVYAYMPTHRGDQSKNNQQLKTVIASLSTLDAYMEDDQVMLVKLHVFNQSQIDFSQFQHILPFPEGYEPYDVLNTADCLITDYSSVFFDFANTRRKIILYTYDEEEYIQNRGGLFFPLSELPFPQVKDVWALMEEMDKPKEYDDQEFLRKFCTYDSADATQKLCRHIFKGEKLCREETLGNGKENVLVFAGSLAKNGITTAFVSLMNHVDRSRRNYFVSFNRWEVDGEPDRVDVIPAHMGYLPLMCDTFFTLREKLCYKRFIHNRDSNARYPKLLRRMYRRELDRYYWGAKFSKIIQFDGYGSGATLLFLESPAKKAIFVHNDMVNELKTKSFQHPATLRTAYTGYDKVAVVSPDLIEPTLKVGAPKEKITLVDNVHDVTGIMARADLPVTFEKSTECRTFHPGGIEGVLNSEGKKFITIGRFSPEKGHYRLLQAFDKFCDDYPGTQLIIIGGYGCLYDSTVRWCKGLKHWKNVTIIKSIRNPMPILKKCDLFILPSLYEGLGLVILEADCLGVPVFSTNIVGPRTLMTNCHGHLVEDSEDGILRGMYDFIAGDVHTLTIDYEAYNRRALQEFETLFEE